jgi:pyrophosphate--fructose-6-phosphate 1-phosphotransferase
MAWHAEQDWLPGIGLDPRRWAIHAVYVPERGIDLAAEAKRLRAVMDEVGCVNIFLAEGAGIDDIVADLEAAGETVGRDPFGHVKIDTINPGRYFADRFSREIGAEKQMVQKSGYFSRSAPANETDLVLVREMAELAVKCALDGLPGVIGHDEDHDDELRAIEFERIAGNKPFDPGQAWFGDLLERTGQA